MKRITFLIIACFATFCMQAQPKAFPTAEGFGAYATGGRGGEVVEVTTLEDNAESPPVGSLRWALAQHSGKPITIVFRVSGIIKLYGTGSRKGELRCSRKEGVTIAGQTAPGDGICIMGDKVNFGGIENLILRHVRFRAGDMNGLGSGKGSIGIENSKNWIIDHCTFGWSPEENMTIYDNWNTTIQWCIVHEGLYDAGHNKGQRSYGAQWGGQNVTFHHNLLAHNKTRSPRFNGSRSNDINVLIDYVNNVNYNWGNQNGCYGSDIETKGDSARTNHTNFVNNYYKPGPARPGNYNTYFTEASKGTSTTKVSVWYMSGNYIGGTANATKNNNNYLGLYIGRYTDVGMKVTLNDFTSPEPFPIPEQYRVITETAEQAYERVVALVSGSGAFPRDAVDARIIYETRTGTASGSGTVGNKLGIIDDPSAVGGYPEYKTYDKIDDNDKDGMDDAWELANKLDPANPADRNSIHESGYTYLEVYLNYLADEKQKIPTSVNTPVKENKTIKGIKYFDIMGKQVSDTSKGLTIRVTTFDDGSSKAEKVFLRW